MFKVHQDQEVSLDHQDQLDLLEKPELLLVCHGYHYMWL